MAISIRVRRLRALDSDQHRTGGQGTPCGDSGDRTGRVRNVCEADLPAEIRYRVTAEELLHEAQSEARLWVALTDAGTPVGFAIADIVDGGAHLDEIDVLPGFARQGIGTRLVRTLIDWARSCHYPALTLITFRHLPWNAPFYERMGFKSMATSEIGTELAGLLQEERVAGIDVRRRVCMKLELVQEGNKQCA